MTSIIYVGMDVHTTNYTISCYTVEDDRIFATVQLEPDYKRILAYLERIEKNRGQKCKFICGYEAGCLGYTLYHQLTHAGIECWIVAPTTISTAPNEPKNDRRDSKKISKCLAYNTASYVYIPTADDLAVKEYMRMRDDAKATVKRLKHQILSFCTRHGKSFEGKSYWTDKHIRWLRKLDFGHPVLNEAFDEYVMLYHQAEEKVSTFDKRIEELAQQEQYAQDVKKLSCFMGISTHTALSVIVETGDFNRFPSAQKYAAFLGLVPGENSSGDKIRRTGITKAGNVHLRTLLVEAAHCYGRGRIGQKSRCLAARQEGNSHKVIAYADRANERLKRKFYKISFRSKRNIAITAVARELACFIWGMMTDHID